MRAFSPLLAVGLVACSSASSGEVTVNVSSSPATVQAQSEAQLVFDPRDGDDQRVTSLDIVHEKPWHLIIVSSDLSSFAHVHPTLQTDGTLSLAHTFPFADSFVLFHDFAPAGTDGVVIRSTLDVAGSPRAAVALTPDALPAHKAFGDVHVALSIDGSQAGGDSMLTFTLTQDEQPVDDLGLYLGQRGHCVALREGAVDYVHTHALAMNGAASNVQFHSSFPTAGTYKAWAQFQVGDELITSDFTFVITAAASSGGGGHHH